MVERIPHKWLEHLDDEDIAYIKRFLLVSGSLKEIARIYGVTYPTVRLRLDRLIEKIKIIDDHTINSPFERTLRSLYGDGKIDSSTFKTILNAHQNESEMQDE